MTFQEKSSISANCEEKKAYFWEIFRKNDMFLKKTPTNLWQILDVILTNILRVNPESPNKCQYYFIKLKQLIVELRPIDLQIDVSW